MGTDLATIFGKTLNPFEDRHINSKTTNSRCCRFETNHEVLHKVPQILGEGYPLPIMLF